MTLRELIKEVNGDLDFRIRLSVSEKDNSKWGLSIGTYALNVVDVGYLNKTILVGTE